MPCFRATTQRWVTARHNTKDVHKEEGMNKTPKVFEGTKRETRVPTPDGAHNTPVHRAEKSKSMKNQWLEIDKDGLRKTLEQKDKAFLLTEMVSNAWDEDITQVEVSLTRPDES